MRALQVVVVVMGVLILAGVVVLGVTFANRIGAQREAALAAKGPPSFGDVQIGMAPGSRVVWASVDAGRLVVHIQGGEAARFEVIDLATGNRLGGVRVGGEAVR